jgi:hypothetical protein
MITPFEDRSVNYETSEEFASCEPLITHWEAKKLLKEHGLQIEEFELDNPLHNDDEVPTRLLLDWMGY